MILVGTCAVYRVGRRQECRVSTGLPVALTQAGRFSLLSTQRLVVARVQKSDGAMNVKQTRGEPPRQHRWGDSPS